MNKVLMIYERVEPTNQELGKLWEIMNDSDEIQLRQCLSYKVKPGDIAWCDIILSVRSTSSIEWRLAKYARSLGKFWILFWDDDFMMMALLTPRLKANKSKLYTM